MYEGRHIVIKYYRQFTVFSIQSRLRNDSAKYLWSIFALFSGEFYLGYTPTSLAGISWYHLIHPDSLREVQTKHRLSK